MSTKTARLYTPQALERIKKSYKRNNILEVAAEFGTSHETIRKILHKNNVRLRRKGEYTDDTKVQMAAYRCAKIIRGYPEELHKEIAIKIAQFIS
jgi:hypothetical protein